MLAMFGVQPELLRANAPAPSWVRTADEQRLLRRAARDGLYIVGVIIPSKAELQQHYRGTALFKLRLRASAHLVKRKYRAKVA